MKKTAFEELLTSVRQAGRIRRGAMKPSRVTKFIPTDVRAVRTKLGTSQTEFALNRRGRHPAICCDRSTPR
jgi:putative transcriptional regulator